MEDMQHEIEPQYLIRDEQKWLDAEKYKADVERYQTEKYCEVINKAIDAIKEFTIKGKRNITIAVFTFVALIFFTMALLTYYDKISGETFVFVAGTIVGYIIGMLKP